MLTFVGLYVRPSQNVNTVQFSGSLLSPMFYLRSVVCILKYLGYKLYEIPI